MGEGFIRARKLPSLLVTQMVVSRVFEKFSPLYLETHRAGSFDSWLAFLTPEFPY